MSSLTAEVGGLGTGRRGWGRCNAFMANWIRFDRVTAKQVRAVVSETNQLFKEDWSTGLYISKSVMIRWKTMLPKIDTITLLKQAKLLLSARWILKLSIPESIYLTGRPYLFPIHTRQFSSLAWRNQFSWKFKVIPLMRRMYHLDFSQTWHSW